MNITQNPARDRHWASFRLPAFIAGKLPRNNFTTITVHGRIVGVVRGGVFHKVVKASIHFLRVPPAISFDISSLKEAEKAGAYLVKIVDKESAKVYQASLSTVWEKGFMFDRGYGQQIALPLSFWRVAYDVQANR